MIKKRFIVASAIILTSVCITPYCFSNAREYRAEIGIEENAIGGEYLVIPLGVAIAGAILHISKQVLHSKKHEYRVTDIVKYSKNYEVTPNVVEQAVRYKMWKVESEC